MGNLDHDSISLDLANVQRVNPPDGVEGTRTKVEHGDILISITADVGMIGLVPSALERAYINQHVALARPVQGICPAYLAWYLASASGGQKQFKALQRGATKVGLGLDDISSVSVPMAPLVEQESVALIDELFSDLDAGVATLERVQAKLKHYRGAVLKAAVEGALTANWRAQHSNTEAASTLLQRILAGRRRRWEEAQLEKFQATSTPPPKDWKAKYQEPAVPDGKNLPPLPEGWCWATPRLLGRVQLGRQRAPQHHQGDFMRPYLRVANVYEDRIDLGSVYEMNFSPEEFASYELHTGDILLNEGQSLELVGRSAIYRGELPGACFTNTLVRFRPSQGLKLEFAQTYFRACLRNHRFRKLARWTTNIAHLGADRFAAMEFPLPPLAEQEAIIEAVEDQLSVIEHLEADLDVKLKAAQALRQSILRHAFTGQLVPQDPNDEPATELIKRIVVAREERTLQAAAAKQATKKAKPAKTKTKRRTAAQKVKPAKAKPKTPRRRTAAQSL